MSTTQEMTETSVIPKHPDINPKKILKTFKFGDLRYVWTLSKLYIVRVPQLHGFSQNIPKMSLFAAPQVEPELMDIIHIALPSDDFWVFGPWYKQGDYVINAVTGATEKVMGAAKLITDTQIIFRIVERIHEVNGRFTTPHGTIRLGTLQFEREQVESDRGTLLRECLAIRVYKYEGMTFIWCKTRRGKYEDCWDTCIHNRDGRFLYNIYNDPIYDVHGMWARDRHRWITIFNKTSNCTSTEPVWWANDEQIECFPDI